VRAIALALAAGIAVALVVYAATGGSVIFLPLVILLPLALFSLHRRS
jgi:hypothetical protein